MRKFTVADLKEFIKDIPDNVEVSIFGWISNEYPSEPKRITYGKFKSKDNESLLIWCPGSHLFESEKYKEYKCFNGN